MKKGSGFLFFISSVLTIMYSCQKDDFCTLPVTASVHVGFYRMQNNKMVKESIYKFTALGVEHDSIINADSTDVSAIILPLSNIEDSCMFVFKYVIITDTIFTYQLISDSISIYDTLSVIQPDTTLTQAQKDSLFALPATLTSNIQIVKAKLTDTLQFYYTRQLTLVSTACGFMYNYDLHKIDFTRNNIDTVLITNSYISTLNEENVKILF
jgi:hypothetical protein